MRPTFLLFLTLGAVAACSSDGPAALEKPRCTQGDLAGTPAPQQSSAAGVEVDTLVGPAILDPSSGAESRDIRIVVRARLPGWENRNDLRVVYALDTLRPDGVGVAAVRTPQPLPLDGTRGEFTARIAGALPDGPYYTRGTFVLKAGRNEGFGYGSAGLYWIVREQRLQPVDHNCWREMTDTGGTVRSNDKRDGGPEGVDYDPHATIRTLVALFGPSTADPPDAAPPSTTPEAGGR